MPCLANSPANTIQMNVKKETIFFVLDFFLKIFWCVHSGTKDIMWFRTIKKKIEHIWHPSNTVKHKKNLFF